MIKQLVGYFREYKKAAFLCMFMTFAEVVLESLIPYIMSALIDKGLSTGSMGQIVKYGLILLFFAGLAITAGLLSAKYSAEATTGFAKNLRKDMYENVQTFSFANIDKFSTASIITRLTTDVTRVQNTFGMAMRMMLRMPLMLIFSVIMTIFISWKLAIIFLIAAPILAGAMFLLTRYIHPIMHRAFRRYDDLNKTVQEDLRGMRVVKAFVREAFEIKKFESTNKEIYADFVKAEKLIAWNDPIMMGIMYTCMLLASFFGAKMVIGGAPVTSPIMGTVFTTGLLNSIFSYSMQVLMACSMVGMLFMMFTMSLESMRRIVAILNEKADIVNPEDPVMEVEDGSIVFENVSFRYPEVNDNSIIKSDRDALSGVNLTIPSGMTVGIIGGTGSSKSTLVQLIQRLYDVTEGSVKVGGVDVRDYDLTVLRDAVSMVLQKNQIFFGSIKDNMRWGNPDATDEEIEHACRLAQADEFIQELPDKYDYHIEQGGTNVSGGQRQRLCIARALMKNPKILIMDDSTSAVDTATDAKIRYAFKNEIPNTTKLIIAQRISSVQEADMIVVMDEGMVNGVGTHEELLKTNEIYKEVYESQQKGGGDADEVEYRQ